MPISINDIKNKALAFSQHWATASEEAVLDARAQFPQASLADLYDPVSIPLALLKAHQKLDATVDKVYEANGGKKTWANDAKRVAFLFQLYEQATGAFIEITKPKRKRGKDE